MSSLQKRSQVAFPFFDAAAVAVRLSALQELKCRVVLSSRSTL
jgi:hypothetical protein